MRWGGGAECRTHKSIDPVQISVIFFLQISYILIILHSLFATRGEGFKGTLKLKGKLTSFLKFPPLKILELSYHMLFLWYRTKTPPSPEGARGGGSGVTLKGKLLSFLKSSPLKTLKLIYYMFFMKGTQHPPPDPPPPEGTLGGWFENTLKKNWHHFWNPQYWKP